MNSLLFFSEYLVFNMFKLQQNTHPDIAGSITVINISAEYAMKYKK